MEYDIFISYKRISIETANNLYYRLTQKGYSVFFDLEEMRTDKFHEQMEKYIKKAKDVFILIEPTSLEACKNGTYKDDWFCREIKIALDNKKHIIPMLLKGYEMPKQEMLPLELKGLTEYNSPKFDIVFFDAYIEKLISKGFLKSEPTIDNTEQSVFKFLSNEDCKIYEGSRLIGAVTGMSDDPFNVSVKRKGEYRYKCINDYTMKSKIIKETIDASEEKYVEIKWDKRDHLVPEKIHFESPEVKGDVLSINVGAYVLALFQFMTDF